MQLGAGSRTRESLLALLGVRLLPEPFLAFCASDSAVSRMTGTQKGA